MKKTVVIAAIFVVGFLVLVIATTFQGDRVRCEVCMEFNGQRDCRTAEAATREEARRAATTNACAQLASGVTQSISCEQTPPASVVWK